jgi:hypothetical protein
LSIGLLDVRGGKGADKGRTKRTKGLMGRRSRLVEDGGVKGQKNRPVAGGGTEGYLVDKKLDIIN